MKKTAIIGIGIAIVIAGIVGIYAVSASGLQCAKKPLAIELRRLGFPEGLWNLAFFGDHEGWISAAQRECEVGFGELLEACALHHRGDDALLRVRALLEAPSSLLHVGYTRAQGSMQRQIVQT